MQKFQLSSKLFAIFLPRLKKMLKPIVELTRKGRPFIWGDAQEKASEKLN